MKILVVDDAPWVVLMDVLMPSMDGVSATRNLEKECLEVGARMFISKPFKIKELINMIESVGV